MKQLKLTFLTAACAAVSLAGSPPVFAGGPLFICDAATRTPYAFPAGMTPIFTDPSSMGPNLTNAEADVLTAAGYAEWAGVATSFFDAVVSGDIAMDITGANAGTIIGTFNGHGGIDVLYDADGTIISDYFGAPPGVLGISSPEFALGCDITESWAVLNGAAVDPADVAGASFGGVFTHEFGHSINLAHTQTNGAIFFFGDATGPVSCSLPYAGSPTSAQVETMYPFINPSAGAVGVEMATVEQKDDVASVSNVYPTGGWPGSFSGIAGTIFFPDGLTEVTGVNVIARNIADPFGDAISALSGDFTQGFLGADGLYTFNGLTPGASYAVYTDRIVAGGFSTSPFSLDLPDQEEFWNDTSEDSDPLIDDRCAVVTVIPMATPPSADVILNLKPDPNEPNDDFASATPFFCGGITLDANIDPLGDVDFFTFTLPADFEVNLDIDAELFGSTLDSTLGLFDSGGTLLGVSDDDPAPFEPVTLDSFLQVDLPPGTYFIGVSSFADFAFDGVDAFTTGEYTLRMTCIAPPPLPGELLGSTGSIGGTLIDIDTATGAGTFRASQGALGPVTEIEYRSDGVLFGSTGGGSSNIITIDPTTGVETLVGTHVFGAVNGLEFVTLGDGTTSTTYFEDFEGDTSGWTATGFWHKVASSPCAAPEDGFSSPVNAFYYGQDATCDFDNGLANSGTLTSPPLTGITERSVFSFKYLSEVEPSFFDVTDVRIVTAGGTTTVWSRDGIDGLVPLWTSSGPISLAAFAGETIQVEFFFDTLDEIFNSTIGWLVDDVRIIEAPFVEVLYGTYIPSPGMPSELVIVDQNSGRLGFVGPTGFPGVGGLAYDTATSTMYGVSGDSLITLDLSTGAGTLVGSTGLGNVTALEFGPGGALFGGLGLTGELASIKLNTGVGTLIGATGFGALSGLAFAPCEDLHLTSEFVNTVAVFEACGKITAGEGFQVLSPGFVTLRAGSNVVLTDGFAVHPGAELNVESLLP